MFPNNAALPKGFSGSRSGPLLHIITVFAAFLILFGLQQPSQAQGGQYYSSREVVDAGHDFFGATSGNIAAAIERVFQKYGLPKNRVYREALKLKSQK